MRLWLNATERLPVVKNYGEPCCEWFAQVVGRVERVELIPGEAEPPAGVQLWIGTRICPVPVGEIFQPGEGLWFHPSYALELEIVQ